MTRMWLGVDPAELCDQHLLGEHKELHQEVGTLRNHPHGRAVVEGHVDAGQVVLERIMDRHDALVAEMKRRGMNHDSPLSFDTAEADDELVVDHNDDAANRKDLAGRCTDCRGQMEAGA